MKNPKISIVIPSYNKADFIYETLDSIAIQKYENKEVIIQDGGSSDGTVDIIKSFHAKYPKLFKWESKKDKGQLDAINKGMNKATGDIVTYINADDVYTEGALEAVAKAYMNNPNRLWFAGKSKLIDGNSKEISPWVNYYKNILLKLNNYTFLLMVNYLMQPSVFITKKAYEKNAPFTGNERFILEYDMWLKLGRQEMPVVIDEEITKFRFEPGTISARQSKYLLECDLEVVKEYTSNELLLMIHKLHNSARLAVANVVK